MKLRPDISPVKPRDNSILGIEAAKLRSAHAYQALPPEFQTIIQRAWARQDRTALSVRSAAARAGIGVSTLWRDIRSGHAVPAIKLSPRRSAFLNVEIDALLEAKTLLSRTNMQVDLKTFVAALIAPSTHKP